MRARTHTRKLTCKPVDDAAQNFEQLSNARVLFGLVDKVEKNV